MNGTAATVVVVGGGISGLTVAYELRALAEARGVALDVTLLEENDWAGGKIRSLPHEGFTLEWGPNGFLDSKPATLELVQRLALSARLLPSDDAARKRFIYSRGRLHKLPESPPAFFQSGLLSWPAKFRLVGEPFARKKADGVEETVAQFARRRLGKQALARLLDPMVSGVFAGDPETLSMPAAFPRIVELEARYGGLIKAMRCIGRERKAARKRGEDVAAVGPAPGGRLTSFQAGLQELPRALADALGDRVRLRARVTGLSKLGTTRDNGKKPLHGETAPRYRVHRDGGPAIDAHAVVVATPAYCAAELLRDAAPTAAAELAEIPYARLAVVALGWERQGFPHPLDGFGFLVPHEDERPMLGALFDSSIFPARRAPEGHVLIRSMVGGARGGHLLDHDDDAIVAMVRGELRAAMGIDVAPKHAVVFRHEKAIPNYPLGHLTRLRRVEQALVQAAPGLFVAGNAYRGIGLNDCVAASAHVALRVVDVLTGAGDGVGFLTF